MLYAYTLKDSWYVLRTHVSLNVRTAPPPTTTIRRPTTTTDDDDDITLALRTITRQVYGLDGYLNNTLERLPRMRSRGGFRNHDPVLALIDQLGSPDSLRSVARAALGGSNPHVIIDDGMHSTEAIANTFTALFGLLRKDGVYIIEGNSRAGSKGEAGVIEVI